MSERERIHAYVDGEIEPSEEREVQRLLSEPKYRSEFESAIFLKEFLKKKAMRVEAEALWQRCRARLDGIDRTRRAESFVSRYAWALASILFLVMVTAGALNRTYGRAPLYASDFASSTGWTARSTPGESPAQMRALLDEIVDRSSWGSRSLALLSAERGVIDGRPVLRFLLGDAAHPADARARVALYVVERSGPFVGLEDCQARDYCAGKVDGLNCVSWQDRGRAFLLVGERPVDELRAIAGALRNR